MNLFVIESPLQLINALEAKEYYKLEPQECMLYISRPDNKRTLLQIQRNLNEDDWYNVKILGFGEGKVTWVTRQLALKNELKKLGRLNISKIFLGDYRSDLMKALISSVSYNELIILDDGAATINTYHRILNKGITPSTKQNKIKAVINKILNLNYKEDIDTNVTFFTVFDISSYKNITVIKNEYKHLKSFLKEKKYENIVYFLGAPLVEKKILQNKEVYFSYLKKINNYYQGLKVVYVPHRAEDNEKLMEIETKLNITIKKIDTPIEHYLCGQTTLPATIASFYSSALMTSHLIFKEYVKIQSFMIDKENLNPKICEDIHRVYSHYKNNFEVISFNKC